jgi:hypothetical protein
LTTLFALHYSGEQSTFGAVQNILSGIIESIPRTGRLQVLNPMNQKEDFSESWNDPSRYVAFVNFIRDLNEDWFSLGQSRGIHNVKTILQRLFGEEITTSVIENQVKKLGEARQTGTLAIAGPGILTSLSSQGTRVPRHTYHGT